MKVFFDLMLHISIVLCFSFIVCIRSVNYKNLICSFSHLLENTTGISVITGIKRRSRLLIRQPHFVKSEFDFDKNNDSEVRKAVKRPLGRQYSDPTPQQNPSSSATTMSEEKPNFLTVPSSYLQKQNSDSALPCQPENSDPLALQTDLLRETVATSYVSENFVWYSSDLWKSLN